MRVSARAFSFGAQETIGGVSIWKEDGSYHIRACLPVYWRVDPDNLWVTAGSVRTARQLARTMQTRLPMYLLANTELE